MITMSQDAFNMYIFQPIFFNAMGIMNTKTRLHHCQLCVSLKLFDKGGGRMGDLPKRIREEFRESQTIRADRVIHDLRWIEQE